MTRPILQAEADEVVRGLYSTFDDETLRELIEFGKTVKPASEVLVMNTALQHELDRREKARADVD